MAAIQPPSEILGINILKLEKDMRILLEIEIFMRIYEEHKKIFKAQYKDYFRVMKFTASEENAMIEMSYVRLIIQDILSVGEYDICGLSYYTDTPEDVIQEVVDGRNASPSSLFLFRILELHKSVRRDLYQSIGKQIIKEYCESL